MYNLSYVLYLYFMKTATGQRLDIKTPFSEMPEKGVSGMRSRGIEGLTRSLALAAPLLLCSSNLIDNTVKIKISVPLKGGCSSVGYIMDDFVSSLSGRLQINSFNCL